jgi:hypothetical protein
MKKLILATAALALAAIPALASEQTFERNLSLTGRLELSVSTGSGNIHLTRGSGSQLHIVGHVHSNWGGSDERVQEIASNPPIEQTGNIVRIGSHHENLHNISIDYEIQAPADAYLEAGSGSGNVTDEGVGENARLNTGSGNIHATGLHGGFTVGTGSGDVYVEQTGSGDVKANTGSGNIELKNIQTGSGSIEMWPGNSGFTLDASTGSGGIHTDPEMTVQGSFDRHHITGKIHGGGPIVRAETGSGDVRVH